MGFWLSCFKLFSFLTLKDLHFSLKPEDTSLFLSIFLIIHFACHQLYHIGVRCEKDISLFFSNFRGLRISRADGAGDLSNFHFIGYNIGDVNYSFRGPYL